MMEKSVPELRAKLHRCLKVAINDEKLECQVGHIVLELAEVMKNPDYHSPTLEVWCDYFLENNEGKARQKGGAGEADSPAEESEDKVCIVCPVCGGPVWRSKEDGFELRDTTVRITLRDYNGRRFTLEYASTSDACTGVAEDISDEDEIMEVFINGQYIWTALGSDHELGIDDLTGFFA